LCRIDFSKNKFIIREIFLLNTELFRYPDSHQKEEEQCKAFR